MDLEVFLCKRSTLPVLIQCTPGHVTGVSKGLKSISHDLVEDRLETVTGYGVISGVLNRRLLRHVKKMDHVRGIHRNRTMRAFDRILDGSRLRRVRDRVKGVRNVLQTQYETGRSKVLLRNDKARGWQDEWISSSDLFMEYGLQDAWDSGYTGKGIGVAVIDTGVHEGSRMLRGVRVGNINARTGLHGGKDKSGHGTWVSSIIRGRKVELGQGKSIQGFTQCNLTSVKSLYTRYGIGNDMSLLHGIERACRSGAKVVNMSCGGTADSKGPLVDTINGWSEEGVIFCVASGNTGDEHVMSPGNLENCLTVGSWSHRDDRKSWFTSSDGVKPDVYAYGGGRASQDAEVEESVVCGSAGIMDITLDVGLPDEVSATMGTSMACPQVAGMVAVLMEKEPDVTVQDIKERVGRGGLMNWYKVGV